ncbi:hypothetical protein L596_013116 [Steinernema carpocapsae]|uniref:SHSP domain-containing protein n=1 Tax=Steinernema carpocapsae TaxID=34508 RepID=A0A4U5NZ76_STECR|nr:hypothetical protein L596_013116 [Steinernema carpocapsae]
MGARENRSLPAVNKSHYRKVSETFMNAKMDRNQMRRMSSTDWEIPTTDAANFAMVKDSNNIFSVKIDLTAFEPIFSPEDVDVTIYENDVQINACKLNPEDPNHSKRELHRQYRMPDDVDLSTVRMQRSGKTVKVDAKKQTYGKPVSFNVVDVNPRKMEKPMF